MMLINIGYSSLYCSKLPEQNDPSNNTHLVKAVRLS